MQGDRSDTPTTTPNTALSRCQPIGAPTSYSLTEATSFVQWALEAEGLEVGDVFRDEIYMRLEPR